MAVQNLYSNLPGHLVEFKDGGLQLTTSTTDTSSTKSLLILGTAVDGPVNEPVKIDENTVAKVFGEEVDESGYPNGATLTKYARQAFKNGFDDVRCMRVTGSQAYAIVTNSVTDDANDEVNVIQKEAFSSGQIYANDVTLRYTYDGDGIFPGASEDITVSTDGGVTTVKPDVNGNTFRFNPYTGIDIIKGSVYKDQTIEITMRPWHLVAGTAGGSINEAGIEKTVKYENQTVTEGAITLSPVSYDETAAEFSTGNSDVSIAIPVNKNGIVKVTRDAYVDNSDPENPVTSDAVEISLDNVNVTAQDNNRVVAIVDANAPADATYTIETVQYYKTNAQKTLDMNNLDSTVSHEGGNDVIVFPDSVVDVPLDIERGSDVTIEEVKLLINGGQDSVDLEYDTSNVTVSGKPFIRVSITAFNFEYDVATVTAGTIQVKYSYKQHEYYEFELKFKSQFGGSQYKDATVEITKEEENGKTYTVITLTKPSAKRVTAAVDTVTYSSKFIKTVDDLVLAMKNDANNLNMFDVEIVKGEGSDSIDLLDAVGPIPFSHGGEDGINPTNDEMFIALSGDRYTQADVGTTLVEGSNVKVTTDMVGFLKVQGAYQILENYNVDYIYPAGIYADSVQNVNPDSDFQRELALLCAVLTYRTKMTHGFIDVKPNSNTTLVGIDKYVSNLINGRSNTYYMLDADGEIVYDEDDNPMDIGWYTSAVVGPEPVMQSSKTGTYYGSPAIAYAALNAVIEPASAPTNKALRNVQGMKFKFSNKQADALVGARYVVFKLKNEGVNSAASSTPYVVDGCTAGAPNCDYARISTVKVLQDVVDQIREVADPFIGEKNTLAQRNALSALISKRLGKLVELEEIQSYAFEISASIQQQLLGEATIALEIVPAMELRKITTVVALRAAE